MEAKKATLSLDARGWRQDGCMSPEYRATRGYARRQAVRYTEQETHDLVQQFLLGFRLEDIAEYHERTVNGVTTQIERSKMASVEMFDKQLTALWASEYRRAWLSRGLVTVYVRAGYHSIDHRLTKCLDIASVTCNPQGKGHFTRFLDWVEIDFMPRTGGIIYVENVINTRLRGFLERRGYVRHGISISWLKQVDKRAPD